MASVPPSTPSAGAAGDVAPDRGPRRRRGLPGATVAILGLVGLVVVVWGGFVLIGSLSETHPDLTPALVAGTLAGLVVLAILGMRAADAPPVPRKRADPEDGGGGSRRPEPAPRPRTPGPPTPDPQPEAPWEDFDAVRSGWERVPAGHV